MEKAVSLRYEKGYPAPFVSAKGSGALAERLIKIAKEHDIPVVEDELLSEALYLLEPGEYIPEEVYSVVAEILVFIKDIQDLV